MLSFPASPARTIAAAIASQTAALLVLLLFALIVATGTASRLISEAQRSDPQQPLAVAGDIDPSFNPGVGATTGGTVNALALQSDGKIVLGGSFTSYNGVSANGIVRINSDGSLDSSFNFGTGFQGTVQNAVNALAIQSDGKILVGGEFTTYNGVSRIRLARLKSDGSLDTLFAPVPVLNNTVNAIAIQSDGKILAGGAFVSQSFLARFNSDGTQDSPFHTTANNTVFAVAVQTDGKILLGGSFTISGHLYFARVNSDGSLDNSFNPSSFVTPNGAVRALVIQSDGKIVVGGTLRQSSFPSLLTRVNADGSTDLSFNPLDFGNFVSAVAIQGDGKILATGSFNLNFGGGVTRNGVIRVNNDGSLDTSFDPGAGLNNRTGQAVAIQGDGRILFAGSFTTYGAATRNGIVRANTDSSLDSSFNPGGGANQTGIVSALAVQADGKIVLGGSFTAYNNVGRRGIARVNSDGSLDSSFDPGTGVENGAIHALAIQPDGKIVVTGGFGFYNGVSRGNIARIKNDGSLDSTFNPVTGLNVNGNAVAIQADGRILVGGDSSSYNGVSRHGIASVNSDGTLDMSFDPGTGANGPFSPLITSIAVQGDGQILISGGLSSYNGVGRNGIARITSSGTLDTSFDPLAGPAGSPSPLATYLQIQTDGKILLAGNFATFNGVNRVGIARLNSNGSLDNLFDPGTGAGVGFGIPGTVDALAIQSNGQILIGGSFFNYNGTSLTDIARINTNGGLDSAFNSGTGPNNIVNALAIQSDGRILVGGQFGVYNGVNRAGIARVFGVASPTIQFSSSSYTINEGDPNGRVNITLTRGGDTTSSASVNFVTNDAAGLTNCNVINGVASPRCDYSNTLGTMTFAAGDTSKTFSIAILDDAYAEGNETFTISLSNPISATLGAQSTATVTITDNDATNGPNPIDDTNFFVRQQYIDFLGREPDPPGFAGWTATINNCAAGDTNCDRIHVSQLFFQSAEFQDRGYFVYRFYPVAFGRKPDYSEFVPDLASVSGFLDANQLEAAKVAFINAFMARTAFVNTYNSLNNTQYVDMLLNTAGVTLSNRQAMIDGLNNSTMTRAQVLRAIVESIEVSTRYNHQAYAVMEYFGYLRRQPDGFYLQWIAVLDQTNDPRGMVTGFATSQEYRNRFGP